MKAQRREVNLRDIVTNVKWCVAESRKRMTPEGWKLKEQGLSNIWKEPGGRCFLQGCSCMGEDAEVGAGKLYPGSSHRGKAGAGVHWASNRGVAPESKRGLGKRALSARHKGYSANRKKKKFQED